MQQRGVKAQWFVLKLHSDGINAVAYGFVVQIVARRPQVALPRRFPIDSWP